MEAQQPEYIRHDASISLRKANLYSLFVITPPVILLIVLFTLSWGTRAWAAGFRSVTHLPVVWLALFLVGVATHELLHATTWLYFGRKTWQAIRFGFDVKTVTPYAHCSEPMTARAYRLGAFAPGFVLGILPCCAGIVTGNPTVMLFGVVFTLAAGGDFLILWLLRSASGEQLVEDHPTRAGCYLLEPAEERQETVSSQ